MVFRYKENPCTKLMCAARMQRKHAGALLFS